MHASKDAHHSQCVDRSTAIVTVTADACMHDMLQKQQAGADLKAWEEQQRQQAKDELEQMEVDAADAARLAAEEVKHLLGIASGRVLDAGGACSRSLVTHCRCMLPKCNPRALVLHFVACMHN